MEHAEAVCPSLLDNFVCEAECKSERDLREEIRALERLLRTRLEPQIARRLEAKLGIFKGVLERRQRASSFWVRAAPPHGPGTCCKHAIYSSENVPSSRRRRRLLQTETTRIRTLRAELSGALNL